MKELKRVKRFKLLNTPKGDLTFQEDVQAARLRNGDQRKTHFLHEQLVFSFLAYRSRYQLPASIREISANTRLHHKSVKTCLDNLSMAVTKVGNRFLAKEPPASWFRDRSCKTVPEHWADGLAYTMFYTPRFGAKIDYSESSRRFGVYHAAVFSFLVSRGKKAHGVIKNFTVSGQAKMFGLSRPTVRSIISDLLYAGFISVVDFGRSFEITLRPLDERLLGYFEPKPKPHSVSPAEKQPRSVERYELKGDEFDDWRTACKFLMPQAACEEAIQIGRELGDCLLGFKDQIRMAKDQHAKNKLSGKIGRGNFGKYFVKRMKTRLEEKKKQDDQFVEEVARQEYFNSEVYKQKLKDRKLAAKADPMHDFHTISEQSILDRVTLSDSPVVALREAASILSRVRRNCKQHLSRSSQWVEPSDVTSLCYKVMANALVAINGSYNAETLATPNQLKEQIDIVLVSNGMDPAFGSITEVANV